MQPNFVRDVPESKPFEESPVILNPEDYFLKDHIGWIYIETKPDLAFFHVVIALDDLRTLQFS